MTKEDKKEIARHLRKIARLLDPKDITASAQNSGGGNGNGPPGG